jgi:hypothetical protein
MPVPVSLRTKYVSIKRNINYVIQVKKLSFFCVETVLNLYTHSLGKIQTLFMLKLVVRIIITGIYRVKEVLVIPGLRGNFWSCGVE